MLLRTAALALTVLGLAAPAAAAERVDVDVERSRTLGSRTITKALPGPGAAAVSFDVRLGTGSRVTLFREVELERRPRALIVSGPERRLVLRGRRAVVHVEAVTGDAPQMTVAGRRIDTRAPIGPDFVARRRSGSVRIASFIASPLSDRRALLLHRLAAWHAVTPADEFPLGVGADGTRRFNPGWTRGFWAGALWHGGQLVPGNDLFEGWALVATQRNFGAERDDTHDLGFMYGRSSGAAYERRCRRGPTSPRCRRLRASALRAADALAALAATNSLAGTIPTRSKEPCRDCKTLRESDTIIDSMMNSPLLGWAATEDPAHRARYRAVAVRHADGVARHLVRPDGSTAQSVHFDRRDGRLLKVHTHQGLRDTSAWARGQGWAVYGFTETAMATGEPRLLDVAERAAAFVQTRNPSGAVPPYDYDAPAGAPTDVSAAVITAAGLMRLERACRRTGRCEERAQPYGDLGERMLGSALRNARTSPPLGMLGGQVHSLGGSQVWDDSGEFIFGLDYALEAVSLATRR